MAVEFVTVAQVGEIRPGHAKLVVVGEREIALFNVAGQFYAVDDICPHQGASLHEGWVNGPVVTCPWHAWCYDVRDGSNVLGDFARIDTFEVRVEGTNVAVADTPRP